MSKRIFVFDAVGTILHPIPDVVTIYHDHGTAFGSGLNREQISTRFKTARQTLFAAEQELTSTHSNSFPVGQLLSSETRERELWYQLVKAVFADVPIADLFDSLWNHFADPSHWAVFPDVQSCWQNLRSAGHRIAIASNFDARLNLVAQRHDLLKMADWCFCSADLGYRKPDQKFYAGAQSIMLADLASPDQPSECPFTMVGDDLQHDVLAPAAFGWQSVWLNRNRRQSTAEVQQIETLEGLNAENIE